MSKYEIILYCSKIDEAYIAEVPELPGCAADGETYREALSNVETAFYFEWTMKPIFFLFLHYPFYFFQREVG